MQTTVIPETAVPSETRKQLVRLVVVLGLAFGAVACSTPDRKSAEPAAESTDNHGGALTLNQGRKWVMAKPMMAHMRKVETAVQQFERTPGGDHAVLAKEIQEDLGRLVTNCTMEGEAHDALHKWLLPFLGLTAEYYNASDLNEQQAKFQQVKQSLVVFNTYFE